MDAKVSKLEEVLTRIRSEENLKVQETEKAIKAKERKDQLKFEHAQLEQKLE